MLDPALVIGQTKHIGSLSSQTISFKIWRKYFVGDYLSYSNLSFTLNIVKHLWRQNELVAWQEKGLLEIPEK